jgi:transposase
VGKQRRTAWREQTAGIAGGRFVFLDESGVTTDMTRRYGRAERGQRVREATPGGHWRTVTMLGAISSEGWQAAMTIAAATDGEVFLAYVRDVLCPTLRPGQVVVMDNLSAHKVKGVAEAIREAGAEILYLPPYSPDFNPIEACWSVVKQHLRKCKPRSLEALDLAIPIALATVSKQIIANCFRHCGYAL